VNSRRAVSINRADITFEVFDDEVVLINFRTGSYFSVGGAGREIVQALSRADQTDASLREIALAEYAVDGDELAQALDTFLADLAQAGLVSVTPVPDGPDAPLETPPVEASAPAGRRPYESPVLRAYDDMQALLLLDPIHEVDQSGWPNAKPAPPDERE
jgi:PqqD family protein of HPr-rel-A system